MRLDGTYGGTVEATNDPERLGRLKVRAPAVYGPATAGAPDAVTTADLPWALPAGLPAGGTPDSGGMVWLPRVGDHVYLRFLDGLPEQPVWEWAMQDRGQAQAFPYWRRSPGGYAGDEAPPDSYLTRYGHTINLARDGLTFATLHGYTITIRDATNVPDGFIDLVTQKGYQLRLDDDADTGTLTIPTVTVNASTLFEVVTPRAHIRSARVQLGQDAQDPVVRLSDLRAAVDTIKATFNAHKHIVVSIGSPTLVPLTPMQVTPTGSDNTFSV